MSKRRTISGRKTLQQIAADHGVHPIQVSQWKKQLLEGASELFNSGKKSRDKDESQAKTPMTYESSLTMRIAISRSAANVNSWDCHAQRFITSPFQCGNPRCGSWRELMPFSWQIPAAGADEWWTTWPEKASRSAGIAYETSRAAWVYGRSTRNHAPRSQVNHQSAFRAWWSSMKSKQWTRSGLLILLTSAAQRLPLSGGCG
jgi:hypothetical protein